jgi:hypothetical protein
MTFCAFVCAGLINGLVGCGSSDSSDLNSTDPRNYGPNPDLTPGELCTPEDPDFDGYRYAQRIPHCRRHVTRDDKYDIGKTYGISPDQFHKYEFDHYLSLSYGGSNSDLNVWPLIKPIAREKSRYEQYLFDEVSSGRMTQVQAVENIKSWRPENTNTQY